MNAEESSQSGHLGWTLPQDAEFIAIKAEKRSTRS